MTPYDVASNIRQALDYGEEGEGGVGGKKRGVPHLALTGMHRWTNRAGEISHRPDDMDGPGGTGAATARQFSSRTHGAGGGGEDLVEAFSRARHGRWGRVMNARHAIHHTVNLHLLSRTSSRRLNLHAHHLGITSPLRCSLVHNGRCKELDALFQAGVDPAARDIHGLTLLHMAVGPGGICLASHSCQVKPSPESSSTL